MNSRINGLMIASLIVNFIMMVVVFVAYGVGLGMVSLVFVIVSVIGMVMAATSGEKSAYIVFMIGCVFFVPIGVIGIIGGRRKLDELKRQGAPVRIAPVETVPIPVTIPVETVEPETGEPFETPKDGVYLNGVKIRD